MLVLRHMRDLKFWKIATSPLLGSPLTRRVSHTDATIASDGLASPVGRVKTRSCRFTQRHQPLYLGLCYRSRIRRLGRGTCLKSNEHVLWSSVFCDTVPDHNFDPIEGLCCRVTLRRPTIWTSRLQCCIDLSPAKYRTQILRPYTKPV